jgi:serine/threonine-protein kinase
MNPEASTQVAPDTKITLIVSDGSQQKINVPNLKGETKSEAQQALANEGWTGNFNVNTVQTFDPNNDGLISDQNPGSGSQIAKDQSVSITVQQFVGGGGGGGNPPTTTTTPNGGGGNGGGPFG